MTGSMSRVRWRACGSAPQMSGSPTCRELPRRWWSLLGLCLVTALVWVTASDISIALPSIGRDLGGSMDVLQWAVNGYFLAGALIIVSGRFGDVFGRRLVFCIGTALVMIGSLPAALADGPQAVIVGRVIQGAGAAAVLPSALAIVAVSFRGRERDTAIGAWIATCWGAQALGPLVGGGLIAALSWRWVFWINLPLGVVALALVLWSTGESRQKDADRRIDVPGTLTLVAGLFLVCYGLVRVDDGGPLVLIGSFGGAVVLLTAFVVVERRSPSPVIALSIFRRARFDGAVVANFIANFVFSAVVFFMALYLQVVEQFSPLVAGALLLPATIPILLANPLGTRWGYRSGARLATTAGMALLAGGCFLLLDLGGAYSELLAPFILIGVGIGLQITPCAAVALEDVGAAGEGVASGVFKAASMIGGSFGVAASTAVFQTAAGDRLRSLLSAVTLDDAAVGRFLDVMTGSVPVDSLTDISAEPQSIVTQAFDAAVARAMWPSIVFALIGAGVAWFLLRDRSARREELLVVQPEK